jgi:protein O-GlcNAc transferase
LYTQGRYADVVTYGKRYIAAVPKDPQAKVLVGAAFTALGKYKDAERLLKDAVRLAPDKASYHNNLALVLEQQGKLKPAIQSYRRAARLDPSLAQIHSNLGFAQERAGQLAEAVESYRIACEKNPNDGNAAVRYWHLRQYCCDWSDNARMLKDIKRLADASERGEVKPAMAPFPVLAMIDDAEIHLKIARAFSASLSPSQLSTAPASGLGSHSDMKPLKIGYLSADFHQHATLMLMAEMFELHDRDRFEVHAISFGPNETSSDLRRRMINAIAGFHDVRGLQDVSVAAKIRELGIDIAVDLKGHTTDSRPAILASRPAPVQAHYLGYPGSMGADFIDYVIADPWVIPEEEQRHYTEAVAYLPDCYQVNDRQRVIASPQPSRTQCGLPETGFVFACFNRSYKITPVVWQSWMRVLAAVPGSVLWLFETNAPAKAALLHQAKAHGIDAARIVFAPSMKSDRHLARIGNADLFLDTGPYGAHTTASDALWAGLPVVTLAGHTFAARVGASLLAAFGLPELITESPESYEALAIEIASDPDRAATLKDRAQTLRDTCALFDTPKFCRNLEALYQAMWQRHCAGEPPTMLRL